jgi:hypothetical protein
VPKRLCATGWTRHRMIWGVIAVVLVAGGASVLGVAITSQYHTPSPSPAAAGTIGPRHHMTASTGIAPSVPTTTTPGQPSATTSGPVLPRSLPVSVSIPAIHVQSSLQSLGLNPDGTLAVPQPGPNYDEAAWYDGSPTPGELGPSVIEGHIDSAANGPSVFFNLGALQPGDEVDVTRADGTVAVFTISGVRQYSKDAFPTSTVYGNTTFAALRLITCGGAFDSATGHYVNNTVVFASLSSSRPA